MPFLDMFTFHYFSFSAITESHHESAIGLYSNITGQHFPSFFTFDIHACPCHGCRLQCYQSVLYQFESNFFFAQRWKRILSNFFYVTVILTPIDFSGKFLCHSVPLWIVSCHSEVLIYLCIVSCGYCTGGADDLLLFLSVSQNSHNHSNTNKVHLHSVRPWINAAQGNRGVGESTQNIWLWKCFFASGLLKSTAVAISFVNLIFYPWHTPVKQTVI